MNHHPAYDRVHYRMLGAIEVRRADGTPISDLTARPKALALLAYLALAGRGDACTRDDLLVHFWPESTTKAARHSLRQALYEIRSDLGESVIETRGKTGLCVNRQHFDADALDLFDALDAGDVQRAMTLDRGELLPGLHLVPSTPEFEAWLTETREDLARRKADVYWTAAREAEARGARADFVAWGHRAVTAEPYNETRLAYLMRALMDGGQQVEALSLYREFRDRLQAELDLEPGDTLRTLAARCREGREADNSPESDEEPATREPATQQPATREPAARGIQTNAASHGPAGGAPQALSAGRGLRRAGWMLIGAAALAGFAVAYAILMELRGDARDWRDAANPIWVSTSPATAEDASAFFSEGLLIALMSRGDLNVMRLSNPGGLGGNVPPPQGLRADVTARQHSGGGWDVEVRLHAPGREEPVYRVSTRTEGFREALRIVQDSVSVVLGLAPGRAQWSHLPAEGALAPYTRGQALMAAGHLHAAASAYDEAIQADSAFALAHYQRAIVASWSFDAAEARRADAAALAHVQRLPLTEATVLEARVAYRRGEPDEAEGLLRALLSRNPHHAEAAFQLADVLMHYNPLRGRPLVEARLAMDRALVLAPARTEALYHVAQLLLLDGDTAGFDRATRRLIDIAPSGHRVPQAQLLRARVLGSSTEWEQTLAELAGERDFIVLSAGYNLAIYGRDPEASLEVFETLTRPDRPTGLRSRAHVYRAELLAGMGRTAEALAEIDDALRLDPLHGAHRGAHLLAAGILDGGLGSPQLAERLAQGGPLPTQPVPRWLDVEAPLRSWLPHYTRALAGLSLDDREQALALAERLRSADDRSPEGNLMANNLSHHLAHTSVLKGENTQIVAITFRQGMAPPEEAVLSPLFSRPVARLLRGYHDLERGRFRQAERWFSSLLEHSVPDLAFAQQAMEGRMQALKELGETAAAESVQAELTRWRGRNSTVPLAMAARNGLPATAASADTGATQREQVHAPATDRPTADLP